MPKASLRENDYVFKNNYFTLQVNSKSCDEKQGNKFRFCGMRN